MDTLSDDIQNIIYKYKHQIEFKSVVNELNIIVDRWCDEQLTYIYCKGRHQIMYNRCKNEFKTLNDYEEHLFINLKYNSILDIINNNYDIFKEWE